MNRHSTIHTPLVCPFHPDPAYYVMFGESLHGFAARPRERTPWLTCDVAVTRENVHKQSRAHVPPPVDFAIVSRRCGQIHTIRAD